MGAWSVLPASAGHIRESIGAILDQGVGLVRSKGDDGLREFLGKFDAWCACSRRRGGHAFRRRLLDGIAYLAKCCFNLCYANAWISIIPWLRKRQALDTVSERFLRFWHMQQQPVEGHRGTVPDGFRGQVLSLHPLSGFFMKDPGLCAVAGRFFASDAHDRAFLRGDVAGCAEYWGLVGAILTAAHLYKQTQDDQQQRRCGHARPLADGGGPVEAANQSAAGLMEEYAAARGLRYASCSGAVRLEGQALTDEDTCDASFRCSGCGGLEHLVISRGDLMAWMQAQ